MATATQQEPVEQFQNLPEEPAVVVGAKLGGVNVISAQTAKPKDPTMHTRWVRNTPGRVAEHQGLGYRLAKESDLKEGYKGFKQGDKIVHRDSVVMICSLDAVMARERERLDRLEYEQKAVNQKTDSEHSIVNYEDHGKTRGTRFVPMS